VANESLLNPEESVLVLVVVFLGLSQLKDVTDKAIMTAMTIFFILLCLVKNIFTLLYAKQAPPLRE